MPVRGSQMTDHRSGYDFATLKAAVRVLSIRLLLWAQNAHIRICPVVV